LGRILFVASKLTRSFFCHILRRNGVLRVPHSNGVAPFFHLSLSVADPLMSERQEGGYGNAMGHWLIWGSTAAINIVGAAYARRAHFVKRSRIDCQINCCS